MFEFHPRWKEELVCAGPGGAFVLELPMGVLSAYLPTEAVWREKAPGWAKELWFPLHEELAVWCEANGARFVVDPTASVFESGA